MGSESPSPSPVAAPTEGSPTAARALATGGLLVLIWGTTWGAITISLEGFPPLKGIAVRFFVAALVLGGIALWRRTPLGRDPREPGLWVVQALGSYAIPYSIVYWAEQWVPSGLTSILWSTFPLFVTLFSVFVLPEERLDQRGWLGMVLGFAGIVVIFSEDLGDLGGPRVATASLVLLASPFISAIANVIVKRRAAGIHPMSLTAVPMGLCAVLVGLVALFAEADRPIVWAPAPVAAMLYLAIVGSAVTFSLYFWLLQHVPATRLALIAYCIPMVAVALGVVVLDEPITLRIVVGACGVLLGVALAAGARRRA